MNKIFALFVFLFAMNVQAAEIGQVSSRGMVPDHIRVSSFIDPQLPNILCYITYYDRSLSLGDSSVTSIACIQIGSVGKIPADNSSVQATLKGLMYRTTRVARMYDPAQKTLIYLVYTDDFSGDNAAHQISVVQLR